MDVLADENVEAEWIGALRDDGHDVRRAIEVVDPGTPDDHLLAEATERERVLLTADRSDFGEPPIEDHAGVVIVASGTRSGGELRRAIRRIDRHDLDLAGRVVYVGDWLD